MNIDAIPANAHFLNGVAMFEAKIIDLETKIAHQEMAIEELQRAVLEQHLANERLEKSLKKLAERCAGLMGANDIGPAGEKPPHY